MNAKIIVGILVSFILGGLMYFIGKDSIESLIVGMLGSIFTILFSIKIDMDNSKNIILKSIKTSKDINSNKALKDLIPLAIKDYKKVESYNNKILNHEAVEVLRRFSVEIEELATKKINTDKEDRRVKILVTLLREAKNNIYSVSYLSRWEEELGKKAFQENKNAIGNGVKIKRIFIVNPKIDNALETISKHIEIGVECYIAIEDPLPYDIKKHIVLVDKTAVTVPIISKNGKNSGGFISFDKKDISKAYDSWKRLEMYSEKVSNIKQVKNKINNKDLTSNFT